mgnify:CR=1 FL=1
MVIFRIYHLIRVLPAMRFIIGTATTHNFYPLSIVQWSVRFRSTKYTKFVNFFCTHYSPHKKRTCGLGRRFPVIFHRTFSNSRQGVNSLSRLYYSLYIQIKERSEYPWSRTRRYAHRGECLPCSNGSYQWEFPPW